MFNNKSHITLTIQSLIIYQLSHIDNLSTKGEEYKLIIFVICMCTMTDSTTFSYKIIFL